MRQEKFKAVCSFDPAIDTKSFTLSVMIDYLKTRDMGLLRFKPGVQPTVFHIREIPHTLWESYVAAPESDAERYRRAFMVGVEMVENVVQQDGVTVSNWRGSEKHESRGAVMQVMADDDLQLFSPAERQEIGAVAYYHSFLPRRIASCFRQPHTLLNILRVADFLPAESSPTSQGTSSAGQSESAALSTPPQGETVTASAKGGVDFV